MLPSSLGTRKSDTRGRSIGVGQTCTTKLACRKRCSARLGYRPNRMAEQGKLAVQQLHELLCQHPLPSTKILVPPRIVVRANIESLVAGANSTQKHPAEQT